MTSWPKERVPDSDHLFMRVHSQWIKDKKPSVGAFQNRGDGMSTDWDKYSTPEETLRRAPRDPSKNEVIKMQVGAVRQVPGQSVDHTPLAENRAHTDVSGEKDTEARMKLRRICDWAIPLAPENQ